MRSELLLRNGWVGLALLALCSGCFLDEIDKAGSWQKSAPKEAEPAAAAAPPPAMQQSNWWASAKSLGSEESKTDIVQCNVGNSNQFMGREDCLARGGSIQ